MFNHASNERKAPEALVSSAKQEINAILSNINGVDFVMLCSTDGFELATVNKKTVPNSGKLAAVSSSILAMVTAFITEIRLSGCQTITLDAENGKAILTAVPAKNHPMIIVTMASRDVLLGQLLHAMKKASENIVAYDARIK